MPCSCSGVRLDKCACKYLNSRGFSWKSTAHVGLMTASQSFVGRSVTKRAFLIRAAECLYEKCVAYNLRYCPFRSKSGRENCLGNTLKEVLVLLCFLVANFVVFVTIVTRIAVHISCGAMGSIHWIKKSFLNRAPSDGVQVPQVTFAIPKVDHPTQVPN